MARLPRPFQLEIDGFSKIPSNAVIIIKVVSLVMMDCMGVTLTCH